MRMLALSTLSAWYLATPARSFLYLLINSLLDEGIERVCNLRF